METFDPARLRFKEICVPLEISVFSLKFYFIYLFIMKFVQLGTQMKTRCEKRKKESIQKYTKSTL